MKKRVGIALLITVFLFSLLFASFSSEVDLSKRLLSPCLEAPFGYDSLGRSLIKQVAAGTLVSIMLSLSVVVLSISIGLILAYFMSSEGRISSFFMVLSDCFKVVPPIILALFLASVSGPGAIKLILALSFSSSSNIARTLYLKIKVLRAESYIKVAESFGLGKAKIFISHILIQLWPYIREQGIVLFLSSILTEASLSYIGCGVSVTTPSLGAIFAEARPFLFSNPHLAIFPIIILLLLSSSLTLLAKSFSGKKKELSASSL